MSKIQCHFGGLLGSLFKGHNSPIYRGWAGTNGPNWVSLWAVSALNGASFVPAVAEIAPQWADQLQGPQGLIWHFGAETDLLNLQWTKVFLVMLIMVTSYNFSVLSWCWPSLQNLKPLH